ncbi:PE-PPE domain-containing protein [Mycobacterium deserti]|uniref:PE-PPE domain-containing protein n=1 Tax=Mycobacterium deserti TaxID=2978347 RepID=A0ABT2MA32_9MYCO|nr:PE-PPE domain-containing protein [Mycobacterium deserti]MCT7658270.1 PE-PPE domain-containing protein [Mycobacterium deserti]
MRKWARAAVLVVLGVLSTAALGVLTAIMAAVSLAATALIVPGTGTPDAQDKPLYMGHAVERYVTPFEPDCTVANCNPTSAEYPASFFPLVIFPGWCDPGRCETWNTSVEQGVASLDGLITSTDGPLVVFGYSQGGAVVSDELRAIAGNQTLLDQIEKVVLIGNIYNPDGGLFTRLGFLPTIPFLDITFGPKTPVDVFGDDGKITSIGFEYDPVMYAPLYWGNPLAMLNAIAAFETVHGYYLTPNENGPTDPIAYGYTKDEIDAIYATGCPGPHCRMDQYNNEYWMIPAKSLPIFDLLMSVVPAPLKPLVQPLVNLLTPVTKVLVDLGYDWSGNPAEQRYLSILPFNPFTNWVQVGFDLVAAVQEGIEDTFGGGATMIAPANAPEVSALSARMEDASQQGQEQQGQLPEGQQDENAGRDVAEEVVVDEDAKEEDAKEEDLKDEDLKDEDAEEDETTRPGSDPVTTPKDDTTEDDNKVTPGTQESDTENNDNDDADDGQDARAADTDARAAA